MNDGSQLSVALRFAVGGSFLVVNESPSSEIIIGMVAGLLLITAIQRRFFPFSAARGLAAPTETSRQSGLKTLDGDDDGPGPIH